MLENVQLQALLTITGAYAHTSHFRLLKEVGLNPLSQRRMAAKVIILYKILNDLTPSYLKKLLPDRSKSKYTTRRTEDIKLPLIKKNYFLKSFLPSGIRLWNRLQKSVKSATELETFKNLVKKYIHAK